jgi:hypothetical protein
MNGDTVMNTREKKAHAQKLAEAFKRESDPKKRRELKGAIINTNYALVGAEKADRNRKHRPSVRSTGRSTSR